MLSNLGGFYNQDNEELLVVAVGDISSDCLSSLNDRGATFHEIADIIEAYVDNL